MLGPTHSELLSRYVRELVSSAPDGWERIVLYREIGHDAEEIIPIQTLECWSGASVNYDLSPTAMAELFMCEYYEACEITEDAWAAMKLEIFRDGRFRTRFFHAGTPMFDGNYAEMYRRIALPFEAEGG